MNKIEKIQKLFYTDRWWGKVLLMTFFYVIFLGFGYWIWIILSNNIECLDCNPFPEGVIPFLYFFILLPILSFVFVFKIKKIFYFKLNFVILFIINLIIIAFNIFLFGYSILSSIEPNFF